MSYCTFESLTEGSPCVECGYQLRRDYETTPRRQCGAAKSTGLGDYTENLLATLGVNPANYTRIKEMFGFAPTCDCDKRKAWLNEVGRYFSHR